MIATFTLAMLMNRGIPGVNLFRAIYYMPSLLTGISVASLWIWVLDTDHGVLNTMLAAIGLPKVAWLTDPNWALRSFVLMGLWGAGGGILIYLAGLKGVPQQLAKKRRLPACGTSRNSPDRSSTA